MFGTKNMPNNDDNKQPTNNPPVIVDEIILPPMPASNAASTPLNGVPQANEQIKQDIVNPSPANSGSAAPANDISLSPVVGTIATPKKKFAGGKIIATILGLFLLVGGVGAGVFLTGQNQNPNEKAASGGGEYCDANGCDVGNSFSTTCYVNHYTCDKMKPGQNCSDNLIESAVQSASLSRNCGSEQIDVSNQCSKGSDFVSKVYDKDCGPGEGGDCLPLINIYDGNWTKVNDPATLPAGTNVSVGIIDRYKTIVFNKARFTVNGTLRPEVTNKQEVFIIGSSGPKMTIFYDNFTVTAGTTNIFAEVEYGGIWYGK